MSSAIDFSPEIAERMDVVAHQLDINARERDHNALMEGVTDNRIPPLFVIVDSDGKPVYETLDADATNSVGRLSLLKSGNATDGGKLLESGKYHLVGVSLLLLAGTPGDWFSEAHVDLIDLLERAARAIRVLSPDDETGLASKEMVAEIYEVLLRSSFVLSGFKDLYGESEDDLREFISG